MPQDTLYSADIAQPISTRFSLNRGFSELGEAAPAESSGALTSYHQVISNRAVIDPSQGKGFREFLRINDDLHAIVTDVRHYRKVVDRVDGVDHLKFHFKLSGDNIVRFDRNHEFRLRGGRSVVALHPQGLVKDDIYSDDVAERSLTLCCRPSLITDTLQLNPEHLPRELANYISGGSIDFFCRDLPLTSKMMQAINDLLNPPYVAAVRHIHTHARMLDLVCMLVDALIREADDDDPPLLLRSRDIEALHEAREILAASLENPLTIPELARRVGLNRTKLVQGFKHVFGESVFDFSQRVRLDHADRLLKDTDEAISAIALAVGYEHQSSFAVAFKARFGHSPRQARVRTS
ncbi:helix-turn-helix transcriptional regulator [Sphingosinicella sp.]|uniref:AraC family transcriptional regulator n=1 Tax=Sphingosinicella sp. TaxID=1917971 RepID=UPI0035B33F4D